MPPGNRRTLPDRLTAVVAVALAMAPSLVAGPGRAAERAPNAVGCVADARALIVTRLPAGTCVPSQPSSQVPQVAECTPLGTACPTWVSEPFDTGGADAPVDDVLSLAPDGRTVYVAVTSGEAGVTLNAYDSSDGTLLWSTGCCDSHGVGYPIAGISEVSRNGDVVYVAGATYPWEGGTECTGILNGYHPETGELLWSRPQRETHRCWSPVVGTAARGGLVVASYVRRDDGTAQSIVERVSSSGSRKTIFRTKPLPAGGRFLRVVQNLATSPDGRTLYLGEVRGERPDPEGWHETTRWSVIALRGSTRSWTFTRRYGVHETNPPSAIVATGDRVFVAGSLLGPFEATMVALTDAGKLAWEDKEPTAQPWPHQPVATAGRRVFFAFGNWDQDIALDGTNDLVAYDTSTGQRLWHDSYRSTSQDTATAYEFDHFPLVATHPETGAVYEILRGYGYVEVRALTASDGEVTWSSTYSAGERTGTSDLEVDASSGTLYLGGFVAIPDRHTDTIVLRYDHPVL